MLYPLSYRHFFMTEREVTNLTAGLKASALPLSYTAFDIYGRGEDLNLRPPAPKAGALAKPLRPADLHAID